MAAAQEIGLDNAVAAFLSELDGVFALKNKEQH